MPEASECQTYNPIWNIDFGGPSGEKLSKLTRIVAHMEDETTPLVGLMFDINGEDIMYGNRGRTEVSFIIDGAGGERISKVIYEQASISLGIWSLEVCYIHANYQNLLAKADVMSRSTQTSAELLPLCQMSCNLIALKRWTSAMNRYQLVYERNIR
jgi:hypothetical protein